MGSEELAKINVLTSEVTARVERNIALINAVNFIEKPNQSDPESHPHVEGPLLENQMVRTAITTGLGILANKLMETTGHESDFGLFNEGDKTILTASGVLLATARAENKKAALLHKLPEYMKGAFRSPREKAEKILQSIDDWNTSPISEQNSSQRPVVANIPVIEDEEVRAAMMKMLRENTSETEARPSMLNSTRKSGNRTIITADKAAIDRALEFIKEIETTVESQTAEKFAASRKSKTRAIG